MFTYRDCSWRIAGCVRPGPKPRAERLLIRVLSFGRRLPLRRPAAAVGQAPCGDPWSYPRLWWKPVSRAVPDVVWTAWYASSLPAPPRREGWTKASAAAPRRPGHAADPLDDLTPTTASGISKLRSSTVSPADEGVRPAERRKQLLSSDACSAWGKAASYSRLVWGCPGAGCDTWTVSPVHLATLLGELRELLPQLRCIQLHGRHGSIYLPLMN